MKEMKTNMNRTERIKLLAFVTMMTVMFAGVAVFCLENSNHGTVDAATGDGGVATVDDLKTAFTSGGDYKLSSSITINSEQNLRVTSDVVLDLSGCSITMTYGKLNGFMITIDGGSLTINDSVGNGSIKSTHTNYGYGIQLLSGSSITVNAGTIESTQETIDVYTISENVSISINGGGIKSTKDSVLGVRGSGTVVDIAGGVLSSNGRAGVYISSYDATNPIEFNMYGGKLEGGGVSGAIQAYNGAVVNISGNATIDAGDKYVIQVQENVKANITGGTFKTTGTEFSLGESAELMIAGGNFDESVEIDTEDRSSLSISDTKFTDLTVTMECESNLLLSNVVSTDTIDLVLSSDLSSEDMHSGFVEIVGTNVSVQEDDSYNDDEPTRTSFNIHGTSAVSFGSMDYAGDMFVGSGSSMNINEDATFSNNGDMVIAGDMNNNGAFRNTKHVKVLSGGTLNTGDNFQNTNSSAELITESGAEVIGSVKNENNSVLVRIDVIPPTNTSYMVGDTLDLSGLKVTAVYDSGDSLELSSGKYTVNPAEGYELNTPGVIPIIISHEGKTHVFEVTVSQINPGDDDDEFVPFPPQQGGSDGNTTTIIAACAAAAVVALLAALLVMQERKK